MPKVTILTSLYNCGFYLDAFLNHLSCIENHDNYEILLLHNEPKDEEVQIINKYTDSVSFKHVVIPERESLYETWNRGIAMANGKYICVWNVDDVRFPDSIYQQMKTLDENPEASLTYGDFYYMYEYGKPSNELVINPEFSSNKKDFFRFHHIGCFPMWRKDIHKQFGYFDEQLRLVGDLDFQIRLSLSARLVKTKSVLGYYLENVPGKLSSNYPLQKRERNLINLRYGMFDHLNWIYIPDVIRNFHIYKTRYKNQYFNIKLPRFFILNRLPLFLVSIFRQPVFLLSYIKHEVVKK